MNRKGCCRGWWSLLLLLGFAAADEQPLNFDIDYARFRINEQAAQVEIYIAVPRSRLQFVAEQDELIAAFECQVAIAVGDSEVVRHRWSAHSLAADSSEIKSSQLLFTQAAFQLPPASYDFAVRLIDLNSPSSTSAKTFKVAVDRYDSERLHLSDLEIASRITHDSTNALFYKNRYTVIPNPGATYGLPLPMLYVYGEIYNLSFPSDSNYSVLYRVFDGQGNQVKELPAKTRPIRGRQLVEVGGFNVVSLPGGSYYLEVRVTDHTDNTEAVQRRKFFVYREQTASAAPRAIGYELLMNSYREQTEQMLDREFAMTIYISTPEERTIYGSLDVDSKRDFLARFWLSRDTVPETAPNEYRDSYLERAKFADENWSSLREGWKTDRGRVLLLFGRPDDVDRFPNSSENLPYEIWKFFEIEGGVEFIFVDVSKFEDYRLVHSSARGELFDADWQRWINPGR